jgi:hypothetical protein
MGLMTNVDGFRTGGGIRRDHSDVNDAARTDWARKQAREERDLRSHVGSYLGVIALLFVIDVISRDGWWFFWPALGWGIAVAFHATQVVAGRRSGPDREQRRIDQLVRETDTLNSNRVVDRDLETKLAHGSTLVDRMQQHVARIPAGPTRDRGQIICDRSREILNAFREPDREPLIARELVDDVLGPAESLLAHYVRLRDRNIASATSALQQVEELDLPLVQQRLDDLRERLHQGDLVSLAVASEMLSLGRAESVDARIGREER